jgi:hypothetical protein
MQAPTHNAPNEEILEHQVRSPKCNSIWFKIETVASFSIESEAWNGASLFPRVVRLFMTFFFTIYLRLKCFFVGLF